jgi:AAA domain-containing protein
VPNFYADRTPIHVDDIFPGFILAADVSSVMSVGGGGKGLLSVDEIARVSRGWPNPPYAFDDPLVDPDTVPVPGAVLHCPREDDPDRTVWWRMNAAGADMTKVACLPKLSLPQDFGKLRSEINDLGTCRLVVIDPWMSAAKSTSSFNQQLRSNLLEPLQEIARDTGTGIWIINHFTKGTNNGNLGPNSSKNLTDYVAGSKAFTDTLRMNTVVVDSPVDSRIKQWKMLKSNGGGADMLEYAIVARFPNDPDAHITWRQPEPNLNDPRVFERIQRRVLDELIAAGRPVTPQEMVQLVQLSFVLVQRALANLSAAGAVTKRRGAYEAMPAISPARAAAIPAITVAGEPSGLPSNTAYIGARLDNLLRSGTL